MSKSLGVELNLLNRDVNGAKYMGMQGLDSAPFVIRIILIFYAIVCLHGDKCVYNLN